MEQDELSAPVAPPPEDPAPQPMSAVAAAERVTEIDALRGLALFGILAANMRGFFAPAPAYFRPELLWSTGPEAWAQHAIDFFISGKFITIFATLFGVGFAIQMERARERGQSMLFFQRRMTALLVFGLLHVALLWFGDILHAYAIAGFLLLLFRRKGDDSLLRWAIGLYWFPMVFLGAGVIATWAGAEIPGPPAPTPQLLGEHTRIFQQGTFAEIARRRIGDWADLSAAAPFFMPRVLSLMLFGVWLWRRGYLRNIDDHADMFAKVRTVGLTVGLAANVAGFAIFLTRHPDPMKPSGWGFLMMTAMSLAVILLALAYASQALLWSRSLAAFAPVGRMALTNYLLQSLICTTIFYSYGGAWFGAIGPIAGFGLTLLIYGLQVPFSQLWLARFGQGPVERLWRWWTYGSSTA